MSAAPAPSAAAADPPRSAAEFLAEARAFEREGELFRAYDIAMHGLQQHKDDIWLQHRAVLCLASAGVTKRAMALFGAFGLARRTELEMRTLHGRLLKDIALATAGPGRREKLTSAAATYLDAYRWAGQHAPHEAYYPGINAATLHLLADERAAAADLAREVLATLARLPDPENPYYAIATKIEAHLILGELDQARDQIPAALAAQGDKVDFRALATTLRQCQLVLEETPHEADWLSTLAPPRVVHYTGHLIAAPGRPGRFAADEEAAIRARIEANFDAEKVGFGYGSLAAGADILFAEALLERGASLHVVLPFNEEEFIEQSVRPSGGGWIDRYKACRAKATTVRFATSDAYLGDERLFGYCSELAMGLALLLGRHLCAPVEQIAVWDGAPGVGEAGTGADAERWRRATGHEQTIIPCHGTRERAAPRADTKPAGRRQTRAMLFGDIKGFSKLTDVDLPKFVDVIMARFARVLDRNPECFEFVNTWGDGLYVVSKDASQAARLALELQEEMELLDLKAAGLPDDMALRVGGHLGPVFLGVDPVLKRDNFFGAHVTRAARIEPVTPPGSVYVTETFAAVLQLYDADAFICDYVGMTDGAKGYPPMRMFLLRRNPKAPPPRS
jgi:class 3 adenylate cyclase